MKDKLTLVSIIKNAHFLYTEEKCEHFIMKALWPNNKPICPCCHKESSEHKQVRRWGKATNSYECCDCHTHFSLRTNTIFDIAKKLSYKNWIRAFISYINGENYSSLSKHISVSPQMAYKILRAIEAIYQPKESKTIEKRFSETNIFKDYLMRNLPLQLDKYIADAKVYYHVKEDNYSFHVLFPTTMSFSTVQSILGKLNKLFIERLTSMGAAVIVRLQTGRPNVRPQFDWINKLPGDVIYTFYIGQVEKPIIKYT